MAADLLTTRVSRAALVVAAVVATGAIGMRLARDNAVPAPTAAAAPAADVGAMIGDLQARVKAKPDDREGWRMLGWSLFQTQRFGEAAVAYRRATVLTPDDAQLWSSLGEAIVMDGPSGRFPDEAKTAFGNALQRDPKDPRARYFLGVARDMAGDHAGAIGDWIALLRDTPAGAPWEADVRRTIEQVGAKNKIDVAPRLTLVRPAVPSGAGAAIPGPSPDQMRAAQALPPGQQDAMVAGMVDRLAAKLKANPGNVEGWVMLIRSRVQLGQGVAAKTALADAIAANPASSARLKAAGAELGL